MRPYIVLRGSLFNAFALNVHASNEKKNDDSKQSFGEKLEQVFDQFLKYYRKFFRKY
jgi:hypothetical protein